MRKVKILSMLLVVLFVFSVIPVKEACATLSVSSGREASITISSNAVNVKVGDKVTFCAWTDGISNPKLRWSVNKKSIATIDKVSGILTAKKTGIVTVTVKDAVSGVKASYKLKITKGKDTFTKIEKIEADQKKKIKMNGKDVIVELRTDPNDSFQKKVLYIDNTVISNVAEDGQKENVYYCDADSSDNYFDFIIENIEFGISYFRILRYTKGKEPVHVSMHNYEVQSIIGSYNNGTYKVKMKGHLSEGLITFDANITLSPSNEIGELTKMVYDLDSFMADDKEYYEKNGYDGLFHGILAKDNKVIACKEMTALKEDEEDSKTAFTIKKGDSLVLKQIQYTGTYDDFMGEFKYKVYFVKVSNSKGKTGWINVSGSYGETLFETNSKK